MMRLKFYTLDVFTKERFGGNPLAVVLGADGLEAATMQRIAREFNLSETVFVQSPDNPAHNAKLRIFTPASELLFAGHPTVGTAILLAELRGEQVSGGLSALVALEEQIGVVRAGVRFRQGEAPFAEFDAPKRPEIVTDVPSRDEIAAAVSLLPSEIGFANHRPIRVSAGASHLFVPVASMAAISKAAPNLSRWAALGNAPGGVGTYLYTNQTEHTGSHFHARMFAPNHGVLEDPATGSAAAALAGVLQHFDQPRDGTHKRIIEQGHRMNRPSLIYLSWDVTGDELSHVRIGGHAVRVTEGEITVCD
jgi:trans-2,3-dihydro-3-hydroxyanthranilate isomerase